MKFYQFKKRDGPVKKKITKNPKNEYTEIKI